MSFLTVKFFYSNICCFTVCVYFGGKCLSSLSMAVYQILGMNNSCQLMCHSIGNRRQVNIT